MSQLNAAYRTMAYGASSTFVALAYHSSPANHHSNCEKQLPTSSSPSSPSSSSLPSSSETIKENLKIDKPSSCQPAPKYQFKSHAFDRDKSMSKGKVANLSCVDGFRSGNMEVGICVAQNMRTYQEDRWVSLGGKRRKSWKGMFGWGSRKDGWFSGKKKNQVGSANEASLADNLSVFAVFDGHGGTECSEFATTNFQTIFEKEFSNAHDLSFREKPCTTQILEKTLLEIDRRFIIEQRKSTGVAQDATVSHNHGGSTAVLVAISPLDHKITCSNVGDSRAILIRKPAAGMERGSNFEPLSSDHSPNTRPDEVERIEKLGGKVQSNPIESALAHTIGVKVCPRVYQKSGMGGLNMTRALGDDYLKPLVVPDPETVTVSFEDNDLYMVLASDGVWDVLSNEDVTKMITDMHNDQGSLLHPSILVRKCSLLIVQRAQLKGGQDNITCMVVRLPPQK